LLRGAEVDFLLRQLVHFDKKSLRRTCNRARSVTRVVAPERP
jgi:hypothetical protein